MSNSTIVLNIVQIICFLMELILTIISIHKKYRKETIITMALLTLCGFLLIFV